jgi:mRNA-degrading endonuclease RelE of RelBE toxin-antitoxin system
MSWRVRLAPVAAEVLRTCAPATRRELRAALRALAQDPSGREGALDVRELTMDPPRLFRLRVGDWRVVYGVAGKDLLVARVFHRKDGYGWLERGERDQGPGR